MDKPGDYPVYSSSNYQHINSNLRPNYTQSSIKHKQMLNPQYPIQSHQPPIIQVKCTCNNKQKHGQQEHCNCGIVSCPRPYTMKKQKVEPEIVKGQSRIQYVPYQRLAIDYVDEERYILKQKTRVEKDYKEITVVDYQPRQVTITDYYAVENIRAFLPMTIPEKYTEYRTKQRKNIRYEYVPVQRQFSGNYRQIVHIPTRCHEQEGPKYLGIREQSQSKVYENVTPEMYDFWEKQYGYKRGQSIETLNQKIREKDKQKCMGEILRQMPRGIIK